MLKSSLESRDFFSALEDSSLRSFNSDLTFTSKELLQTYNVVVSPILDNNRRLLGKLGVFRDITELKKMERDLYLKNSISTIFLSTPDNEMYREVMELLLS